MTGQVDINGHRAEIDRIDESILVLLNERQRHSLAIRTLKTQDGADVYDPAREADIVSRLQGLNNGPLGAGHVEEIYRTILKVSKEVPTS